MFVLKILKLIFMIMSVYIYLQIHCNAAQSLCDIVRLGREQFIQQQDTADPDPLLVTMEQ